MNSKQMEIHNKCREWQKKLNTAELQHLEDHMITSTIDLADVMKFVFDNADDIVNCKTCYRIAQKLGVIQ